MKFNPNNHDRFRSQRPNDEIIRQAIELIRHIKNLGLDRLQIETEEGVVFLQTQTRCHLDEEF